VRPVCRCCSRRRSRGSGAARGTTSRGAGRLRSRPGDEHYYWLARGSRVQLRGGGCAVLTGYRCGCWLSCLGLTRRGDDGRGRRQLQASGRSSTLGRAALRFSESCWRCVCSRGEDISLRSLSPHISFFLIVLVLFLSPRQCKQDGPLADPCLRRYPEIRQGASAHGPRQLIINTTRSATKRVNACFLGLHICGGRLTRPAHGSRCSAFPDWPASPSYTFKLSHCPAAGCTAPLLSLLRQLGTRYRDIYRHKLQRQIIISSAVPLPPSSSTGLRSSTSELPFSAFVLRFCGSTVAGNEPFHAVQRSRAFGQPHLLAAVPLARVILYLRAPLVEDQIILLLFIPLLLFFLPLGVDLTLDDPFIA
jgi:hypothetical protein